MGLKDRDRTPARPTVHGAPCSIGEVYRSNLDDPSELAELNAVLYEEDKHARAVWEELKSAGYQVAWSTVNKHRGGTCRCFTIDKDICCGECRRNFAACVCKGDD